MTTMKTLQVLVLAGSAVLANTVLAADDPVADPATQTDIIGSKEAPSVFNIVPWKEKAAEVRPRAINTSVLRETLQPLDPDVLRREVQLQQPLGQP